MPWDRTNAPLMPDEALARRARDVAEGLAAEFQRIRAQPDADPEAYLERLREELDRAEEDSDRNDAAVEGLRLFLDEVPYEPA